MSLLHLYLSFPPYIKLLGGKCLTYYGTEGYQDLLEEKWTRAQWEAIRWRLMLPTYEEIAKKLGVAYQNVQKRLKAANWDEFSQGVDFVEKLLTSHLQKGAIGSFTSERV